ncbi:MAG: acetate/propionate family kinase [Alphaproteobacteria bacterium]|nr:acetate/propionate family kinase [Alphaproteobacteria bacterium]
MAGTLLVLNAGSSSLKFSLFPARRALGDRDVLCAGEVDGLLTKARLRAHDGAGTTLVERHLNGPADHTQALDAVLGFFEAHFDSHNLVAVGHRVVHGGRTFDAPVRIDARVIRQLRALVPLAPLHQPHNLAAIEAMAARHPKLPQIACFDTAFHMGQPDLATRFGLPQALYDEGVHGYGFHGLSYDYVARQLPQVMGAQAAEGRIVVAHLGSGASMCALKARKSVATTMRFTPLDGLVMGTRCGQIDPGVLLYLLDKKGMTAKALEDLLYHQSGLLGVSGISDDMRILLASSSPAAQLAVDLFVYQIGRELGSLAAALGGVDALVFTAGIGEHAIEIRRRVCADAGWLGIILDEDANRNGGPLISCSAVSAWTIPTNEDLMIARHVIEVLKSVP